MRLVFVAPPFAGHLNPMILLACAARQAGHQVDFVTGERKHAVLAALGFTVRGLDGLGPDALEAIANSDQRVGGSPRLLLQQLRENLSLMPRIRAQLVEAWAGQRPDLVVADSVAAIAGTACDELGIPWITTIATPFALENRRGVPAYCGGWGSDEGWWPRMRNATGRRVVHGFKQAAGWWFRHELEQAGLPSLYRSDGTERIYSSRAILGFGIEELEFERDWPPAFQMIGPVIEAPEPCPPLAFPPARMRVLVTLGTHLLWAKQTLVQEVSAMAPRFPDVEFVVSMGRPEAADGALERVAPGVSACQFVPYSRDLPAFDRIVHHGGTGIVNAALLAGVPSLVIPHDYDQFDWAARVSHFGLGLRAARLTSESVAGLLDRRDWPELTRLRAVAQRYRPAETFLDVVERIGVQGC